MNEAADGCEIDGRAGRRRRLAQLILTAALGACALWTSTAQAAYPGTNGKLVVSECLACAPPPSRVWTINPDGSDRTQIAGDLDYDPVFSGSGQRVAFTVRDGKGAVADTVNIYTANPDGTDVRQVTTFPTSSYDADLSSDGSRIVFTSPRAFENGQLNYDVYIANSDGTDVTRLTTAQGSDDTPSFSPDDKKIVFTSQRDGDFEVYSMDVDGQNQTRLTNSPGVDDAPEYSPDGGSILFRTRRNDDQSDLYAMNPDGTNQHPFVADPNRSEVKGVYSPDGKQVAFSAAPINGSTQVFDTYVAAADGSGAQDVTNTPDISELQVDWQPIPDKVARTCDAAYPNLRGGTNDADDITGTQADEAVLARGGADRVVGGKGDDCMLGGNDADELTGNGGGDQALGGAGDDTLRAGPGDDRASGQGGDDAISGGKGDDELSGGAGADVIRAGDGRDKVECGAGKDRAMVEKGDKVADDCEQVIER